MSSSPSPYHTIAALKPHTGALKTSSFFEPSQASQLSPLDDFIANVDQLNLLAATQTQFPKDFSALLLLGYMSAVESYMRRLVGAVVQVDEVARRKSASKSLIYGASLCSAGADDYADALLDAVSFAGRVGIVDACKDFLGLKGFAAAVEGPLQDYQEICELRHCCVHRFGRLGAKNAVALGIDEHAGRLGYEFRTDLAGFEEIASRLRNFVKGLNNTVWERIMERTARNRDDKGEPLYSVEWAWKWPTDRRRFKAYWDVFAARTDSIPSPEPFAMYETFRSHHRAVGTRR